MKTNIDKLNDYLNKVVQVLIVDIKTERAYTDTPDKLNDLIENAIAEIKENEKTVSGYCALFRK